MEFLLSPLGRSFLAVIGLLGLVALAEGLRLLGVRTGTTRGLVHVGVGGFVVVTPWIFSGPGPVYGLSALFVGGNALTRARGWWTATHGGRQKSWGTVLFPLAVLPCLAATWSVDPGRTPIFQTAFLVLAVADPIATWVGTAMARPNEYRWEGDHKSLFGSTAFFVMAFAATVGVLMWTRWAHHLDRPTGTLLAAAGLVALVTTVVEAVSRRGWDNFFVPLAGVTVLLAVGDAGVRMVWIGVVGGAAFGVVAYWMGALTRRASVLGALFASLLVIEGWAWLLPGLAFFVLSSSLSFLPRPSSSVTAPGSTDRAARSVGQVYANGGLAWAFLLGHVAWGDPLLYAGAMGAFAAAAADTWATELGTRFPARAWSVRTGDLVPAGTSGAVTMGGTVAAVVGAGTVVGAGFLGGGFLQGAQVQQAMAVLVAGTIGMGVDSLIGATIQAQYEHPQSKALIDEPPRPSSRPVRGFPLITNEVVNLAGTAVGAIAAVILC